MTVDSGRKALHAYVSDEAHEKWHGFAEEQGVSVSAILEVLAGELEIDGENSTVEVGERLNMVVTTARRIDAQRRRRSR